MSTFKSAIYTNRSPKMQMYYTYLHYIKIHKPMYSITPVVHPVHGEIVVNVVTEHVNNA